MTKRTDYISWEEFFMGVAQLSAQRSKDPSTQVGACIANCDNHIVATGYNGSPIGVDDEVMPWGRDGDFENSKYAYVVHAEANAILNADGRSLKDTTLYTTLFPCNECAKIIIQAGIKKVVYLEDKYPDADQTRVAKKLFEMVGIKVEKFEEGVVRYKEKNVTYWPEVLSNLRKKFIEKVEKGTIDFGSSKGSWSSDPLFTGENNNNNGKENSNLYYNMLEERLKEHDKKEED